MRVFLDTNVLASGLATRGLCADVVRSVIEFHELVACDLLSEEVARVLRRKFAVTDTLISDAMMFLANDTIRSEDQPRAIAALSDDADQRMISAACNGRAAIFVTGDKEVQNLGNVGQMRVLSPRQFWEEMSGQRVKK